MAKAMGGKRFQADMSEKCYILNMSEFIEPREPPVDYQQRQYFQNELQREISPVHVLSGSTVQTPTHRIDVAP